MPLEIGEAVVGGKREQVRPRGVVSLFLFLSFVPKKTVTIIIIIITDTHISLSHRTFKSGRRRWFPSSPLRSAAKHITTKTKTADTTANAENDRLVYTVSGA